MVYVSGCHIKHIVAADVKHILAADVKHILAPQQQYAREACCASGGQMGVGLGCYAEPKQGGLVGPVAKICFMLRPLYGLCVRLSHKAYRGSGRKAYPGSGRKAYPGASTTICQRGVLRFGRSDGRWAWVLCRTQTRRISWTSGQ